MTLDNYDSKIKNIETITEKLLGDKLSVYFFNELKLRHSSEIYYTLCEKLEYILYAQIDEKNKYNNINLNIIFEIHKLYNTNNQMRELFIFYQLKAFIKSIAKGSIFNNYNRGNQRKYDG